MRANRLLSPPLSSIGWRRGRGISAPWRNPRFGQHTRKVLLICICSLLGSRHGVAAEPRTTASAVAAQARRAAIDLSGEWEFRLDPLDVGRAEKWFEQSVPYERRIQVPGAWNAQGVAFESADQLRSYEAQRLEEQKPLNNLGTLGVQRESDRLFSAFPGPG